VPEREELFRPGGEIERAGRHDRGAVLARVVPALADVAGVDGARGRKRNAEGAPGDLLHHGAAKMLGARPGRDGSVGEVILHVGRPTTDEVGRAGIRGGRDVRRWFAVGGRREWSVAGARVDERKRTAIGKVAAAAGIGGIGVEEQPARRGEEERAGEQGDAGAHGKRIAGIT